MKTGKRNKLWWTVVCALGLGVDVQAREVESYDLQRGDVKIIQFEDAIRSIESSRPNVAKVEAHDGDRAIRLEASAAGETTIEVLLRSGDAKTVVVRVMDELESTLTYLRKEVGEVLGLDVVRATPNRSHAVLSGTIALPQEWHRFRAVVESLPRNMKERVINQVQYRPPLPLKEMQDRLAGLPGLLDATLTMVDGATLPTLRIGGRGFEPNAPAAAETLIQAILAQNAFRPEDVNLVNGVRLESCDFDIEIIYFEMTAEQAERIGVDLLNGIGLNLGFTVSGEKGVSSWPWTANVQLGSARVDNNNVQFSPVKVLQLLAGNDYIYGLSRQTVSVRNGETGLTRLGGTITVRPQATAGGGTTEGRTVDHGFSISVTPNLQSERRVFLHIASESLTPQKYASGVGDIEVIGGTVNTHVTLSEGTQRVLMAFDRKYREKGKSGVPVLRDIPVLNWFFGSRSGLEEHRRAAFLAVVRARTGDGQPIFPALLDETDKVIEVIRERMGSASVMQP